MIDHLSTYATDYLASRAFYDAAMGALGFPRVLEMSFDADVEFPGRRACAYGPGGKPTLWLVETRVVYTPRHTAFAAADRPTVDRFHAAGLGAGGVDHGAPGPRMYHEHYYGAFLLDPDGNNVEAVCHRPVEAG